jgi:hypothetical protein
VAFTYRLPTIVPSFGSPFQSDTLFLVQGTSLSTTSATNYAIGGTFAPTVSRGYVRIKIYGGGGTTPAISLLDVVLTDGTNYVVLTRFGPSTALPLSTSSSSGSPYTNSGSIGPPVSASGLDMVIPFLVDINVTGASINLTMTGTSPTAKLDAEVSGVS